MYIVYLLVGVILLTLHTKTLDKSGWVSVGMPAVALVVAPPLFFAGFYHIGDAIAGEFGALALATIACCGAGALALNSPT